MIPDLVSSCFELVNIYSVSHQEESISEYVLEQLSECSWLEVEVIDSEIVAKSNLGLPKRVLFAGHLDTVPSSGNFPGRIEGDSCWGLGSVDMKAGLSVFLELAKNITKPSMDVTFVFYTCEEVDRSYSGLGKLYQQRPDLIKADAVVLGEPSGAKIEAGCQGTMRILLKLTGVRAHTARPWMGRNAIHRLHLVLAFLNDYDPRSVLIDGCEFKESLQAVKIEGGIANNVVPDEVNLAINFRFAPDRNVDQAFDHLKILLEPFIESEDGDSIELIEGVEGALPNLSNPVLASLAEKAGSVNAKLGWTDVATFSSMGVPATNFGPGDPGLAHSPTEHVTKQDLETVYKILFELCSQTKEQEIESK